MNHLRAAHVGLAIGLAIVWVALSAPVAGAQPWLPPPGEKRLGVSTTLSLDRFNTLTNGRHTLRALYPGWPFHGADEAMASARANGYIPMFHLKARTRNGWRINMWQLKSGAGDRNLVTIAYALNAANYRALVRPMAEMNGHWNYYCAFNQNGTPRRGMATKYFRQAFRRIAIIMRGGARATINRKLRAHGMPTLKAWVGYVRPSGKVGIVWNPQGEGNPRLRANRPGAYFPGYRYVDIVANDLFGWWTSGSAKWDTNDLLYRLYPKRPYMIAEWGQKGGWDVASYARRMFSWVRTHRRVRYLVWFEGGRSDTKIQYKPRIRAVYRANAGLAVFR